MKLKASLASKLMNAVLALSVGVSAQIAIPNAGFESWTTVAGNNPDIPDGWKDYNGLFPGIHKESSGHAGSYALRISVAKYFTGAGSGDIRGGFSMPTVATAPLYFGFWAKVHIVGTDHLNVTADLSKPPSTTITTTIPYGRNVLSSADNTSAWTWFTFALETTLPQAADSASLRFTFSPALDTGSNVVVDDIAFTDSKTAGIGDPGRYAAPSFSQAWLEPFPPLITGNRVGIRYTLAAAGNVSLAVYDMRGARIATLFHGGLGKGGHETAIDAQSLAAGTYFVQLAMDGKSQAREFIVRHR